MCPVIPVMAHRQRAAAAMKQQKQTATAIEQQEFASEQKKKAADAAMHFGGGQAGEEWDEDYLSASRLAFLSLDVTASADAPPRTTPGEEIDDDPFADYAADYDAYWANVKDGDGIPEKDDDLEQDREHLMRALADHVRTMNGPASPMNGEAPPHSREGMCMKPPPGLGDSSDGEQQSGAEEFGGGYFPPALHNPDRAFDPADYYNCFAPTNEQPTKTSYGASSYHHDDYQPQHGGFTAVSKGNATAAPSETVSPTSNLAHQPRPRKYDAYYGSYDHRKYARNDKREHQFSEFLGGSQLTQELLNHTTSASGTASSATSAASSTGEGEVPPPPAEDPPAEDETETGSNGRNVVL